MALQIWVKLVLSNRTYLSVAYIAQPVCQLGYRPDGRGSIPGRGKIFLFFHSFQTDSGAHTVPCIVGTGRSVPGGKAARGVKLTTPM
jgi:hypothetical protein